MHSYSTAIIITVLNEGEGLRSTMEAFLNQTETPDEVVVVDGGSTDQTISILKEFARRDSRVKIFLDPGVNIARGRNLAIDRSRAEILAVTDGGCLPEPTWFENLVKPLIDNQAISAVSGNCEIDSANAFEHFAGLLSWIVDPGNDTERLFFGRSSAFRRDLWKAVGGYPEWLYTGEDTLFALRAKSLGSKVHYSSESIVKWRPRDSWRKLAKQYFLYGKGNGRIGRTNLRASIYHVRNHSLWFGSAIVGFFYPFFGGISAAVICYIYWLLAVPELRNVRREEKDLRREFYVPAIIFVRNVFSHLGQLFGAWEYRFHPTFRKNLHHYMNGLWKPSPPWSSVAISQ